MTRKSGKKGLLSILTAIYLSAAVPVFSDLGYVPILLYEALKHGVSNPSMTFQGDAAKIPRKIYPVYLKIHSRKCRDCRYSIGRAWINRKELRYGKANWEFESLSGEMPETIKVELEETRRAGPIRTRTMYGRIESNFQNIISLELTLQE